MNYYENINKLEILTTQYLRSKNWRNLKSFRVNEGSGKVKIGSFETIDGNLLFLGFYKVFYKFIFVIIWSISIDNKNKQANFENQFSTNPFYNHFLIRTF